MIFDFGLCDLSTRRSGWLAHRGRADSDTGFGGTDMIARFRRASGIACGQLPAQQQGLLTSLPRVRDDRGRFFVVAGQAAPDDIDPG